MPFPVAAELPRQNYALTRQVELQSWQTQQYSPTAYRSQWLANDVSYVQLSKVSFGVHRYPLTRTLAARFTPPTFDRTGILTITDLPESLRGEGSTPSVAQEDFELRFHKEFQRLAALRPFEMTSEDSQLWQRFRSIVDVPGHIALTPQFADAYGTVVKVEHSRVAIHWEDGSRNKVDFRRLPANMVNFRSGQSFRASLKRSATGRLLQVLSVTRCRQSQPIAADVMTRLRESDASVPRQTGSWT